MSYRTVVTTMAATAVCMLFLVLGNLLDQVATANTYLRRLADQGSYAVDDFSLTDLGMLDQGEAQSTGINWLQLRSGAAYPDGALVGAVIVSADMQSRTIVEHAGDLVVVGTPWVRPPVGQYTIFAVAR